MTVLTEIPLEFESYLRDKTLQKLPTNLNEFIFAYIPDLDLSVDIDRNSTIPNENLIVHRAPVASVGKTGENAIVYSAIIDSTVPEFTFNAIYLHDKEANICGMIIHQQDETKQQAMTITKSALMQYDSAAASANVTIDAETWQVDISDLFAACSKVGHTHVFDDIEIHDSNLFINGCFSVWQRPHPNTVGGYCADRWFVRPASDVLGVQNAGNLMKGNGAGYYLYIQNIDSKSFTYLEQRIEISRPKKHYCAHTLSFEYENDIALPDACVHIFWREIGSATDASKRLIIDTPMQARRENIVITEAVPEITSYQHTKKYMLTVQIRSSRSGAAIPNGTQRYSDMSFRRGMSKRFVVDDYSVNLLKCQRYCYSVPYAVVGDYTDRIHSRYRMTAFAFPTSMRARPAVSGNVVGWFGGHSEKIKNAQLMAEGTSYCRLIASDPEASIYNGSNFYGIAAVVDFIADAEI